MTVTFEDAMEWLDQKLQESDFMEEDEIIEWIKEMIWRYDDMRNFLNV